MCRQHGEVAMCVGSMVKVAMCVGSMVKVAMCVKV